MTKKIKRQEIPSVTMQQYWRGSLMQQLLKAASSFSKLSVFALLIQQGMPHLTTVYLPHCSAIMLLGTTQHQPTIQFFQPAIAGKSFSTVCIITVQVTKRNLLHVTQLSNQYKFNTVYCSCSTQSNPQLLSPKEKGSFR